MSNAQDVLPHASHASGAAHHQPKGKLPNTAVSNADAYYPENRLPIGTPLPSTQWPDNKDLPPLFKPLKLRNLDIKNRIWVSPMCQYSSDNGKTSDWHLVHLGAFAVRGAGLIEMEASAVTPEGRITPEDNGIWSDDHVPNLKRIVDFVHSQGGVIGVQLAHAGRKASTRAPWVQYDLLGKDQEPDNAVASVEEGGWPEDTLAPSAIPWHETYPKPKAVTEEGIETLIQAFEAATKRAIAAGFDFVELHGAHGYLIHEFVSPISNKRTDRWGGSFENRIRFPLEIAKRVRKVLGDEKPLLYRVSGTDWAEGPEKDEQGNWLQWGVEQTIELTKRLVKEAQVDLLDVSSGGNTSEQKIPVGPGYQVHLAEAVKKAIPDMLVTSVGLITSPEQANEIVASGKSDAVYLAREFLRNVDFVTEAAAALGVSVQPAVQYARAHSRMLNPSH